jgi:hypothetical protein
MLHKSEVKEWLKHPVTKAFQEALRLECQAQKQDLSDFLDETELNQEAMHEKVTISKAGRHALLQLTDENAGETIISVMLDHNQIEEDEENGSN